MNAKKQNRELIFTLKTLKDRLTYIAPELVRAKGPKAFDNVCAYYSAVIKQLEKEAIENYEELQ